MQKCAVFLAVCTPCSMHAMHYVVYRMCSHATIVLAVIMPLVLLVVMPSILPVVMPQALEVVIMPRLLPVVMPLVSPVCMHPNCA